MTLKSLLTLKIIDNNNCWIYTRYKQRKGKHGQIRYKGKMILVHRLIMHFTNNFNLDSKEHILHKPIICKSPSCFNPDHLYIGDHYDNMNDKIITKTTNNQNKNAIYCQNGHEFNSENTGLQNGNRRYCKICKRNRETKRRLSCPR